MAAGGLQRPGMAGVDVSAAEGSQRGGRWGPGLWISCRLADERCSQLFTTSDSISEPHA